LKYLPAFIAVLEVGYGVFEVLSTFGDTHLGGDDFDKRVVDWLALIFKRDEGIDLLKDKQTLQRLIETTEKAKMELSSLTQANIGFVYCPFVLCCFFYLSSRQLPMDLNTLRPPLLGPSLKNSDLPP
ncbi:hypothetical protein IFM89_024902, partial [Coptis chinensis]